MIVKIQVTADDIAQGVREDECRCPVALASHRAFPSAPGIVAGLYELFAGTPGRFGSLDHAQPLGDLPDEATQFILHFDSGRPVEPFEFDIDVPDELAPGGAS